MKYFVSVDSAARSVGADETALALTQTTADAEIVRTGSRGLYWLEPLIEVEHQSRRIGFGPVAADEAAAVVAAVVSGESANHDRYVGDVDRLLHDQGQRRLTFARCGVVEPGNWDEYISHGGTAGLRRALGQGSQAI